MDFFEPYSRRNLPTKPNEVYQYTYIPQKLKIQIIHILNNIIDPFGNSLKLWKNIADDIKDEFGILNLQIFDDREGVHSFLLESDLDDTIDAIDIIFNSLTDVRYSLIDRRESYNYLEEDLEGLLNRINHGIDKVNFRFKQHGFGFEIIDGYIVKIDNQFIHHDIIKPAISLLFEEDFETASEEFLQSHGHYRKGEYEEAITDAERAFESTMKIICHKKGYEYNSKDSARKLIQTLLRNEFIPSYLQNEFNHLCNTLECGLPTIRNRNGSHGQGAESVEIPEYMVNFALNLCASNIVFLVKVFKSN